MQVGIDPVSRYFEISYDVPASAPDVVTVRCSWAAKGSDHWQPARVRPMVSDTAMKLLSDEEWAQWTQGVVTERRAAGLTRTVLFDPYPQAQPQGTVDACFRVCIEDGAGNTLATCEAPLSADNTDVVYLTDWSKIMQTSLVRPGAPPAEGGWGFRPPAPGSSFGELAGKPGRVSLRALTYPLDLKGWYAVYVRTPTGRAVCIRRSGQECGQRSAAGRRRRSCGTG